MPRAEPDEEDRGEALRKALRDDVLIACVGPVTAAPIAKAGLPHAIPDRARTAALVRLVTEELPNRDA